MYDGGFSVFTGGASVYDGGLFVTGGLTVDQNIVATGQVSSNLLIVTSGASVYSGGMYITGGLTVYDDIYATGNVYSSNGNPLSDVRLKTDIMPVHDSLARLSKMRGVYFSWATEGQNRPHYDEKRHLGVIAQEVQAVLPEIVDMVYGGEYLGIRYQELIPLLINAVKELDEREALKDISLVRRISNDISTKGRALEGQIAGSNMYEDELKASLEEYKSTIANLQADRHSLMEKVDELSSAVAFLLKSKDQLTHSNREMEDLVMSLLKRLEALERLNMP